MIKRNPSIVTLPHSLLAFWIAFVIIGGVFFMETIHCIYFHRKADTKEVFYVGQSKSKQRPKSKLGRNFLWKRVVEKHGFIFEIVHNGLSKKEVDELEIKYIAQFGRLNLGTGCLVNMTDGADGTYGVMDSEETRLRKSMSHIGKKRSKETIEKMSKIMTGKKYNLTDEQRKAISDRCIKSQTGRKKSQSEIEKLRLTKIGKKRPDWVREKIRIVRSKPIIIIKETAIMEFKSVTDSTFFLKCSRKEVCRALKLNEPYKGFMIYYL